jgi:hypothetical protein
MYTAMSPQWAGTLLGLVQVALMPIPFVFYKWGDKIRAKSRLIKQMREDQERREQKAAAAMKRQQRRDARDVRDAEKGEVMIADDAPTADVEQDVVSKTTQPITSEKE